MAIFIIGNLAFDDPGLGLPRNPGPLDVEWGYEHRVQEYKIPGYKDMTQVTSNMVLRKCTVTIRTTDTGGMPNIGPNPGANLKNDDDGRRKFDFLQYISQSAGPYTIQNSVWPPLQMYLKSSKFRQTAGEKDWVGTWTLVFIEKFDG